MTEIEKTIIVAQNITHSMNLEGFYPDPYSAVRIAANSMERGLTIKDDRTVVGPQNTDHASLVAYIADGTDIVSWVIRDYMSIHLESNKRGGRKIAAIKVLRAVAGVSLKEAKEAVEAYQFKKEMPL